MFGHSRLLATPEGVASKLCLVAAVCLGAFCLAAVAGAQSVGGWELRVCADPDNLPYSNRAGEGYENRLAQVVAYELGATLTYAWMPLPRKTTDAQLMLRLGACDVVGSVADGVEPFLNTISYYTAVTYFVTKQGTGLEDIESLDDPRLRTLRIGVDRASPLDFALQRRVDQADVHHYLIQDSADAILQDVVSGALDVGVVRGPVAGYFTAQGELPLNLVPVTPEIDIPFLALVQPITMAVRRGDDALRDQLNRVLTLRWDDVQAMLDGMAIARPHELAPGPPPETAQAEHELRIGVILPTRAGEDPLTPENLEPEAGASRNGALLADELLGDALDVPIRTFMAAAPTADVAERAARRMAALDSVSALLGGAGPDEAVRLTEVSADLEIPFMNVVDPNPGLRSGVCSSTVFNVVPSYAGYLSAMTQYLGTATEQKLAVIRVATPQGRQWEELLRRSLPESGWSTASIEVQPLQPYYGAAIDQIRAADASAVVLLLDADEQLVFLGQYETAGLTVPVLGMPVSGAQLRQYYWTLTTDAPSFGTTPRFAMWDAAVPRSDFNDAYRARYGQQAEAPAWAAFVAVQVLQQAARAASGAAGGAAITLLQALLNADATYNVAGSPAARFGAADHQLGTPVYVLKLKPAPAGVRFDLAELTDVVGTFDVEVPSSSGCN